MLGSYTGWRQGKFAGSTRYVGCDCLVSIAVVEVLRSYINHSWSSTNLRQCFCESRGKSGHRVANQYQTVHDGQTQQGLDAVHCSYLVLPQVQYLPAAKATIRPPSQHKIRSAASARLLHANALARTLCYLCEVISTAKHLWAQATAVHVAVDLSGTEEWIILKMSTAKLLKM